MRSEVYEHTGGKLSFLLTWSKYINKNNTNLIIDLLQDIDVKLTEYCHFRVFKMGLWIWNLDMPRKCTAFIGKKFDRGFPKFDSSPKNVHSINNKLQNWNF